jgi:hypothetical protein
MQCTGDFRCPFPALPSVRAEAAQRRPWPEHLPGDTIRSRWRHIRAAALLSTQAASLNVAARLAPHGSATDVGHRGATLPASTKSRTAAGCRSWSTMAPGSQSWCKHTCTGEQNATGINLPQNIPTVHKKIISSAPNFSLQPSALLLVCYLSDHWSLCSVLNNLIIVMYLPTCCVSII